MRRLFSQALFVTLSSESTPRAAAHACCESWKTASLLGSLFGTADFRQLSNVVSEPGGVTQNAELAPRRSLCIRSGITKACCESLREDFQGIRLLNRELTSLVQ